MNPDTYALVSSTLHWGVGGLLAIAVLAFIQQFLLPGMRAGQELQRAVERLSTLRKEGPVLDLDRVRIEVMVNDALRHCWDEYRDTLHGQKQPNAMGMLEISRWRATAMANGFFTEQTLVDAPLRTEFYKHLPGILTGLGIIGTFSGLILGLQGFKVSDDATVVRTSLETLIVSVGGAFVLSGTAIALAMVATTFEKFIVNSRYTQLESLCGLIDSMFDSGAGEEYLQRLVEASETSATQAMQMKESLVTDLKQVLSDLAHQQITAMSTTSTQLGQVITSSLNDGLKEPLARISDAVQTVGNSQGEAVNKLLTDVLGGFTAQMENMFGGQMRGMNEMLVQTANTIQTASQRFEQMASQIQQSGSGAADAMAKRMDEALQQMQVRQAEANDQMRVFVDQLKDSVAKGQSESAELTMGMMRELSESTSKLVKGLQEQAHGAQQQQTQREDESAGRLRTMMEQMQETLSRGQAASTDATGRLVGDLGAAASGLVNSLQGQAQTAQLEHAGRQADLALQMAELLNRQSEQTAKLTDSVQQASSAMREAIQQLQTTTNTNVERMGLGAERLQGASNRLGDNLDTMKTASDGLGTMADKLNSSSSTLSSALVATQQTLGDQKAVRDALATMVADLRSTIENSKREATITSELVDGLQVASQRLNEAQRAADSYLEGVTEVLGESHGAFAKQMEITLREGNRVFHEELAQATGLLKGAIQELGDLFDNLPTPA
ncbi:MAG: anti-phage ZorAB system protein ZorA [Polaromonas sp.]